MTSQNPVAILVLVMKFTMCGATSAWQPVMHVCPCLSVSIFSTQVHVITFYVLERVEYYI